MKNSKVPKPYRRKRKYVRPDLQARLILGSLGITLAVSFVGTHIPLVGLWKFTAQNMGENNALIDHMARFFSASFYVSILLTASLATWFGYWYSFKFCGPIYAMKKYFTEMTTGPWHQPFRLREKDDLKDVRDAINDGMNAVRTRLEGHCEVLQASLAALESKNLTDEERAAVIQAIRVELDATAQRLPNQELPMLSAEEVTQQEQEQDTSVAT